MAETHIFQARSMTPDGRPHAHLSPGILAASTGHLRAAQARWSRLSPSDLSGVRHQADLVACVELRYGLSHEQAVHAVTAWDAQVRGVQVGADGAGAAP